MAQACPQEIEVRKILKAVGAELIRATGHEVWRIPGAEDTFTCDKPGRGKAMTWRPQLSRVKRLVDGAVSQSSTEPQPQPDDKCYFDEKLGDVVHRYAERAQRCYCGALSRRSEPKPEPKQNPAPWAFVETKLMPKKKKMVWTKAKDKILIAEIGKGTSRRDIVPMVGAKDIQQIHNRAAKLRRDGKWLPQAVDIPAPKVEPKKITKGYTLELHFPGGRSTKAPLTKRQAEEWALRILSGDL
jgi:hypothetical protein